MKIEDISTGGGCVGYYVKYKGKTFYLTTFRNLTLPKKNSVFSIGIYDIEFEDQLASKTLHNFDYNQIENYVKETLGQYLELLKSGKKHTSQHDFFDLDSLE